MEINTPIPVIQTHEITVFLSELEARQFVQFQQHYDVFSTLLTSKVFEQRGASITLHFDQRGQIKNITREDVLFVRGDNFPTNA